MCDNTWYYPLTVSTLLSHFFLGVGDESAELLFSCSNAAILLSKVACICFNSLCWFKSSKSNFCCCCKSCVTLGLCCQLSLLDHSCIHSVLQSIHMILKAQSFYFYLMSSMEVASFTTDWNCGGESSVVKSVLFKSVCNCTFVIISAVKWKVSWFASSLTTSLSTSSLTTAMALIGGLNNCLQKSLRQVRAPAVPKMKQRNSFCLGYSL